MSGSRTHPAPFEATNGALRPGRGAGRAGSIRTCGFRPGEDGSPGSPPHSLSTAPARAALGSPGTTWVGSHTFRVLPGWGGARPPTDEWRACAMMVFLAGAAVANDLGVVTHEVYHIIKVQGGI